MKKFLLLVLLLSVNVLMLHSQTFTVEIDHTEITDTLGKELVFHVKFKNNDTNPMTVYLKRESFTSPDGWTSSFCFTQCLLPTIDSVETSPAFGSEPIPAGGESIIEYHVFTYSNEGTANIQLIAGDTRQSSPPVTLDLTVTANSYVTSVTGDLPFNYYLDQNYPNPFNPATTVKYGIQEAGNVLINVYNSLGQKVLEPVKEFKTAGNYTVNINAANLPSGIYYYELKTNNFVDAKKMLLVK